MASFREEGVVGRQLVSGWTAVLMGGENVLCVDLSWIVPMLLLVHRVDPGESLAALWKRCLDFSVP